MTTNTVTARRKGDPQHMSKEKCKEMNGTISSSITKKEPLHERKHDKNNTRK